MRNGLQMAARFEHCDENISKLLDDKDSKNTEKASKGSHLIFKAYLQERKRVAKGLCVTYEKGKNLTMTRESRAKIRL